MLYTLITVLIVIVCVLLILIVLVQNSKGGGLSSAFSSSNQVMGVRKTTDFLEKATWTLAIALLVLSFAASANLPRGNAGAAHSAIEEQVNEQALPNQTPSFPAASSAQDDNTNTEAEAPAEAPAE